MRATSAKCAKKGVACLGYRTSSNCFQCEKVPTEFVQVNLYDGQKGWPFEESSRAKRSQSLTVSPVYPLL